MAITRFDFENGGFMDTSETQNECVAEKPSNKQRLLNILRCKHEPGSIGQYVAREGSKLMHEEALNTIDFDQVGVRIIRAEDGSWDFDFCFCPTPDSEYALMTIEQAVWPCGRELD